MNAEPWLLGWGTYNREFHPRPGVLLDAAMAAGVRVEEIVAPARADTAARLQIAEHPLLLFAAMRREVRSWYRLTRRARRRFATGRPDAVLVGYLGHFDVVVARLVFPRARLLLDHLVFMEDTARDRGIGSWISRALLRAVDRAALRAASVVIVDTEAALSLIPRRLRRKATVIPVGAPDAFFDARRSVRRAPARTGARMSAVFYGLFTPLQGAPVIARAAAILAERGAPVDITMIGDGQDADAARRAAANAPVAWVPWVAADALPAAIAEADVCLGIFGTGPKAMRVVPNKVYQGLAAGCAVVTSDTPAQRAMLGDAVVYTPPGDAVALADALEHLAAHPAARRDLAARGAALADARFSARAIGPAMRALVEGAA